MGCAPGRRTETAAEAVSFAADIFPYRTPDSLPAARRQPCSKADASEQRRPRPRVAELDSPHRRSLRPPSDEVGASFSVKTAPTSHTALIRPLPVRLAERRPFLQRCTAEEGRRARTAPKPASAPNAPPLRHTLSTIPTSVPGSHPIRASRCPGNPGSAPPHDHQTGFAAHRCCAGWKPSGLCRRKTCAGGQI
jgi:hypothetical protein